MLVSRAALRDGRRCTKAASERIGLPWLRWWCRSRPYTAAPMDGTTAMPRKRGPKCWVPRHGVLTATTLALILGDGLCRADGRWSASIGATSDYVLRGVSQTYDSAAVQLGGSYQSPEGWFAGAWGSNVNPYPHYASSLELDVYAGITRPISQDFSSRLTLTHYAYLDDPRPAGYDYDEISLSAAYLDRLAVTASIQPNMTSYSNVGFARHELCESLEVTSRWPVWRNLSLSAGAGFYDLERLFGVSYWAANVGASYTYRRLTIEVAHYFAEGTVSRLFSDQSSNGTWALSAVTRF
jgi:uncharacterized protein (TIGR02001 family)